MCDKTCVTDAGYECMYHKAEYQYECRRPWESWTTWDNPDTYSYESGIAALSLSLLPITFQFLL